MIKLSRGEKERENLAERENDTYFYEVEDPEGNTAKGQINARSLRDAIRKLERTSFKIIALEKSPIPPGMVRKKIDRSELMFFFKELSVMHASGIQIGRALGVLENQAQDPSIRIVFTGIRKAVEQGRSLSQSLSCFPALFSKVHIQIIKAGEMSGMLESSFQHLAEIMERELNLEKKVKSALVYPLMILLTGILGSFFVFLWAFPYIKLLIGDLGVKLPFHSMLIITIFEKLQNFKILIPVLLLLLFIASRARVFFKESLDAKIMQEKLLYSIPGLRELLKKVILARALIVLESLTVAGIHIPVALELAAETSSSLEINYALRQVSEMVRNGDSLGKSMERFPSLFPKTLVGMVSVGEESGEFALMFGKTAHYFDIELSSCFESFTRLIEPFAIITMGIIMSIFVLSFILPIYLAMNQF